jgi:iron(III) transport system permease protein
LPLARFFSADPQQTAVLGGLGALLGVLVLLPLGILLFYSIWSVGPAETGGAFTLSNYTHTFVDPTTYRLLFNTLVFAAGSMVIGLVLGISLAWLIERTNAPFRNFAFVIAIITAGMPPLIFAMAWVFLLNPRTGILNMPFTVWLGWDEGIFKPYNLFTLVIIEGFRVTPTIFLMIIGLFRSMDPSLEEASAMSGAGLFTTLRKVTLPVMLPGLLGVTIFIGTATIGLFEIPAILGMPGGVHVFSTRIYIALQQLPSDYGLAASLGTVAGLLGLVGIFFYHRVTRIQARFATVTGKGYRPRRIELGRWRPMAGGAIVLYFFVMVVVPVAVVFYASLFPYFRMPSLTAFQAASLDSYRGLWHEEAFWIAFKNSMTIIAVVPITVMLLSSVISWFVVRGNMRGKGLIDSIAFLPFTAPSIVFGLAFLLIAFWVDGVLPIYGTIWLIAIAHISRFLPFGTRTTNGAMIQLHRELEEAGSVSGASWFTVFRLITLRLLIPSLLAGWLWIAVHSGRELSIALLLANSRENQILSALSWSRWENGRLDDAAALGIVLMGIMAIFIILARVLMLKLAKENG